MRIQNPEFRIQNTVGFVSQRVGGVIRIQNGGSSSREAGVKGSRGNLLKKAPRSSPQGSGLPTQFADAPEMRPDSNDLSSHSRLRCAGFSMIEVSVAIAVMAFGIIAVLGLFSISLGGSKDTVTDSVVALKAMDILANAKGSVFTNATLDIGVNNVNLSVPSNTNALYFSNDGMILTNHAGTVNTNAAQASKASYGAQILTFATGIDSGGVIAWNPAITNSITNSLTPSTNMALLQIRFIYPAMAPSSQQTTNYFQTVIVNRASQ